MVFSHLRLPIKSFQIEEIGGAKVKKACCAKLAVFHSMATANLKKSEDFVTNTTAASKYIPRRPRISIN